jgi:hypothetical protein
MAFDTINVGVTGNDGTGDTIRVSYQKTNTNFGKAVEAPASTVTDGRIAVFDGTSGKLLKQASVAATSVVAGPASATNGYIAVFDGVSGKVIRNGTKVETDVVIGPASATDGRVAVYDGVGGKLLKDGTKLESDLVTGPASVTAARIAEFSGTSGKVIAQSSVAVADLLPLTGGTMTGGIVTDKQIETTLVTLGTSGTITVDLSASMLQTTGTLSGNITSLVTSNRSSGRSATLRIINGGTSRTVAYSSSWRWVGAKPANPFTLSANKLGILTLTAFGANETDVIAAWAVEP